MKTTRLEAFSDGVLAIIITIMVLELKIPESPDLHELKRLFPVLISYILSFIYIGIYWNNHHHLMHGTEKVSAAIMWANLHLLFWLSLIPFVTGWIGENNFAKTPMAFYGTVLFMCSIGYWILKIAIFRNEGKNSKLEKTLGKDYKGKISPILYAGGVGLSFVNEYIAGAIYIGVALMWLIPESKIEEELD